MTRPDRVAVDRNAVDWIAVDWIAVDWGTTRLRVWAMGPQGVLASAMSGDGMGGLAPDEFEPALLRLAGDWLAEGRVTPAIACGMVGARQGWHEAPYRAVPCRPLPDRLPAAIPGTDPRIAVHVLPGLSQARPADVMRGEETQIAGLIARAPGFDGVACLPGTHTKWVRISAGEVVSFQTFMTGEMFALLSGASVLRHSVAGDGWDDAAFLEAADDAIAHPARLAARLFGLRAASLLDGLAPDTARARLSGCLIGAELAAARPYWLGQEVVLVGAEGLTRTYATALAAQGGAPRRLEGEALVLAGLTAAHATLKETAP